MSERSSFPPMARKRKPRRAAAPREPASADASLHPLGWAGLLLDVPADYRLAKVDGTGRRGTLVLADAQRPRIELSWATVTRRRFDAAAFSRGKLERSLGRRRRAAPADVRAVEHPAYAPLLRLDDPQRGLSRYVGYAPAASRVIECVYHHGRPSEDRRFRELVLPSLRDQPADAAAKWAFFDVSFIAPPGFSLAAAKLDLGDMRVTLRAGRKETSGPWLTVRQVYPAELALRRQPLEKWLDAWLREGQQNYRAPRAGLLRRGPVRAEPVHTSRGPGVVAAARLRRSLRPFFWRMPRALRAWMVHDAEHDRLLGVQAADRPERVDAWLETLLAGMHWAADRRA